MNSTEISLCIDRLEAEIEAKIAHLLTHKEGLLCDLREALSREWVAANGVTMKDVQLSSGDGVPWFDHIQDYANWLAENSTRRWAEWNGRLYYAAELMAGKMHPNAAGLIEHVPKEDVA